MRAIKFLDENFYKLNFKKNYNGNEPDEEKFGVLAYNICYTNQIAVYNKDRDSSNQDEDE